MIKINDKNKCVIAIIIYYIHMYLYITFLYLHSIYNLCDIYVFCFFFCFMGLNVTFNNISVISWLLVLLVEEAAVPGENHRPVASH